MRKEEVVKILEEKVDWVSILRKMTFGGYNEKVIIWDDGSIGSLDPSTYFQDETHILGCLRAPGMGNLDDTPYLDGWGKLEDGKFSTDDGRMLTYEEALEESIVMGEWEDTYIEWRRQIMEEWEEEATASAMRE